MKVWQGLMRDVFHFSLIIGSSDWKYKGRGFLLDDLMCHFSSRVVLYFWRCLKKMNSLKWYCSLICSSESRISLYRDLCMVFDSRGEASGFFLEINIVVGDKQFDWLCSFPSCDWSTLLDFWEILEEPINLPCWSLALGIKNIRETSYKLLETNCNI
jgi:hypothetical protein